MPLILMLITARFELLRPPHLYAAAAIVVMFAGPAKSLRVNLDGTIGRTLSR